MKILGSLSVAAVGLGCFACSVGVESQQEEQTAQVGQAVCSNVGGVNAVLASFAVAVAKELHRWNGPADFRWNSTTGMLELTATGLAQCGGTCRNVQALLDMQKPEAYLAVTFPDGTKLNSYALRSVFQDGFNRQSRCNAWQGEYTTNGCWVDPHYFYFNTTGNGPCAKDYYFWVNTPNTSTMVPHPDRLQYQLYFVGYPNNPYLNYHQMGGDVVIDPTVGLTEGDSTSSGSCDAACTRYSTTSVAGDCCSCNGAIKTYSRSPFSASMYLCR